MKNQRPTTLIQADHIGLNAVLEIDYHWNDSEHLAILCHPNPKMGGNMMNKVVTTLYRFYRDFPMNVVRFNYRGVGQSSGHVEYGKGEFLDTLCVLSWAIKQSQAKHIHIAGFSFGGFIACLTANEIIKNHYLKEENVHLEKLILIAPSIEKNNPEGLFLDNKNTFVIYGDKDDFVSPKNMEKFSKDFGLNNIVIKDTAHFFDGKQNDLKNTLNAIYIQNTINT